MATTACTCRRGTGELAVVGAGPAGLAAAIAAARAGVQVTLLDEYPRPGGQYLKAEYPRSTRRVMKSGAPHPDTPPPTFATERRARALLHDLLALDVDLRTETLVWGVAECPAGNGKGEGLRLALHSPRGLDWLEARAVVVATGARELVIPFPGWTLPGVMTLGAAQILAKEHKVPPGRRVLLAGSGPLLLPVANELIWLGAEVIAVLEATHPGEWLRHGPTVWGHWHMWDRLHEGWHYLRSLRRARVPYHFGRTVIQALGSPPAGRGGLGRGGELEAAVIARLDRQGWPIPGSEETVAADTLCLGFGFLPNIELTQLAGCVHEFDPTRGGWVPQVDERLESSRRGLFVAGETAGVGGAEAALVEGRVAGLAAAQRLGYIGEGDLAHELAALAGSLRRLRRFGEMLNTLFIPRPGLDAITTDDTLICRCEEVSAGEVRAAVRRGAIELDALKVWTRVGQGPCQGRTCGPLLARLIASEIGQPVLPARGPPVPRRQVQAGHPHGTGRLAKDTGFFHVRPPLKPVPLGDLASAEYPRSIRAEYPKGEGRVPEG
jgi:NADPH-dependent 2,4-dienoyl-CoA reductase/sulfur reductase-like enzyme